MAIVSQDCFTRLMKIHYFNVSYILFRVLFLLYYNIVVISEDRWKILFDLMARFQMKNILKYIQFTIFLNNFFQLIYFNSFQWTIKFENFYISQFLEKCPIQWHWLIWMMNIVIVSKYILKLRIKHKQLEHIVYQIQSQKLIKHNFGNNYNSNRTKHCNPIINKKKR